MSLIQLLSVGHSLRKSEDRPGTYRLESEGALPRFQRGTQPAPSTDRITGGTEPVQPSLFSQLVAAPANEEIAPDNATPRKPEPAAAKTTAPVPATRVPAGSLFPTARKETGLIARIRDFFSFGKGRRAGVANVQTELALERVTVVRNDLSDADLEVVKKKVVAANTTMMTASERRQTEGWVKLTNRFLRKDKNVFQPAPAAKEQSKAPELISKN